MRARKLLKWLAAVALAVVLAIAVYDYVGILRARSRGVDRANADIQTGTPSVRRSVGNSFSLRWWPGPFSGVNEDGIGVDAGTGLPVESTWLGCGTGVNFDEYDAMNEAYNEVILAALQRGDLREFIVRHKLRTADQLRATFTKPPTIRFERDGDKLSVANGQYTLEFYEAGIVGAVEPSVVQLTRPPAEAKTVFLVYGFRDVARRQGDWKVHARGALDIWIVDDETTALIRDEDKCVWVLDLPRGLVLQVHRPVK